LLEGDPAQQQATSKIRRRAIFLSVGLQSLAVTALVVFPLLSKGERIPVRIFVERPPYRLGSPNPSSGPAGRLDPHSTQPCFFCKRLGPPGRPTGHVVDHGVTATGDDPGLGNRPFGDPNGVRGGIPLSQRTPKRPDDIDQPPKETKRVVIGHIDPAYLKHRIEPQYPTMGIQLRRETRVELQAVIATDGSIQSLQVLSGDPLFFQSALDAVRQWQYSPTILNGRAVEVDTHITVIYTLNH
jgi:protein TonB